MPQRKRSSERGMTLVELMVAVAVFTIVIAAVLSVIVTGASFSQRSLNQNDAQRGARMALANISQEIELAGLGLPARLAIKDYVESASGITGVCDGTQVLEVAAVDLSREWVVSSTTATSITLADPTPTGGSDTVLRPGEWVFFYQNPFVDGAGTAHGHGMVQVDSERAEGDTNIAVGSTAYSSTQTGFDLSQGFISTGGGHQPVLMRTRTSRFGINCDNSAHPYLFLSRDGQDPVPLVANVEELRFRFLVDATGPDGVPDGQPDDQDGSGTIDAADMVTNPDITKIYAVEIYLRVRADKPDDPKTGKYREVEVSQLAPAFNLHTIGSYIFVDNTGL